MYTVNFYLLFVGLVLVVCALATLRHRHASVAATAARPLAISQDEAVLLRDMEVRVRMTLNDVERKVAVMNAVHYAKNHSIRLSELCVQAVRYTDSDESIFTAVTLDAQQILASSIDFKAGQTTPLDDSFCKFVVALDEPFIVNDTSLNPLTRDASVTVRGDIRSYLGVPLRSTDSQVVGALCVYNPIPRQWTDADVEVLEKIAEQVKF